MSAASIGLPFPKRGNSSVHTALLGCEPGFGLRSRAMSRLMRRACMRRRRVFDISDRPPCGSLLPMGGERLLGFELQFALLFRGPNPIVREKGPFRNTLSRSYARRFRACLLFREEKAFVHIFVTSDSPVPSSDGGRPQHHRIRLVWSSEDVGASRQPVVQRFQAERKLPRAQGICSWKSAPFVAAAAPAMSSGPGASTGTAWHPLRLRSTGPRVPELVCGG